ncbi:MAG: hypothetical protein M0D57_19635 [Sphingobacteriales bacterium JAD_PAG50586_3]|nr:MAG: hypothetical protein M0D57_19635 [Sphingobacteriales bacterium JAD_PAG50586_3]
MKKLFTLAVLALAATQANAQIVADVSQQVVAPAGAYFSVLQAATLPYLQP